MNNFEKVLKEHKDLYMDRFFSVVATNISLNKVTGEVGLCENCTCDMCAFSEKNSGKKCTNAAAEWLRQEE